jgi:hypothetical protein
MTTGTTPTAPSRRVTAIGESELYARGAATLLASWKEYARGSSGAALLRLSGVAAAVFPREPERGLYNNALLDRDLGAAGRTAAVDAMEAAYSAAGIERYAAWVHETDEGMRGELGARGYMLDESTLVMGMSLDDIALPRPDLDLRKSDWSEYLGILGLPAGCSAALTRPPSTSSSPAWASRTSPPRWPSITTATVACSTWDPRGGTPPRARHRAHGAPRARRGSARLLDSEPSVDGDGRARLRGGRFPRPRPVPRVRARRDGAQSSL